MQSTLSTGKSKKRSLLQICNRVNLNHALNIGAFQLNHLYCLSLSVYVMLTIQRCLQRSQGPKVRAPTVVQEPGSLGYPLPPPFFGSQLRFPIDKRSVKFDETLLKNSFETSMRSLPILKKMVVRKMGNTIQRASGQNCPRKTNENPIQLCCFRDWSTLKSATDSMEPDDAATSNTTNILPVIPPSIASPHKTNSMRVACPSAASQATRSLCQFILC